MAWLQVWVTMPLNAFSLIKTFNDKSSSEHASRYHRSSTFSIHIQLDANLAGRPARLPYYCPRPADTTLRALETVVSFLYLEEIESPEAPSDSGSYVSDAPVERRTSRICWRGDWGFYEDLGDYGRFEPWVSGRHIDGRECHDSAEVGLRGWVTPFAVVIGWMVRS